MVALLIERHPPRIKFYSRKLHYVMTFSNMYNILSLPLVIEFQSSCILLAIALIASPKLRSLSSHLVFYLNGIVVVDYVNL